ncbi:hypothetical protein D3C81_2001110 [compost metagenome]
MRLISCRSVKVRVCETPAMKYWAIYENTELNRYKRPKTVSILPISPANAEKGVLL